MRPSAGIKLVVLLSLGGCAAHPAPPPPPRIVVKTVSGHLRNFLCLRDPFIALVPKSFLQINADTAGLKILPIELPMSPLPVTIVTLKNRTLSRTAELFLDCARNVAKSISQSPKAKKAL